MNPNWGRKPSKKLARSWKWGSQKGLKCLSTNCAQIIDHWSVQPLNKKKREEGGEGGGEKTEKKPQKPKQMWADISSYTL